MVTEWLQGMSLEGFCASHFQKTPFALPGAASNDVPRLTWETVGRILAVRPPPDLLVVRDGALLPGVDPRSLDDALALMRTGCSIVLRETEKHDAGLRALAQRFERDIPGKVRVQVYVTPKDHHSFGWHYDAEDVFIVQTAGTKEYLMRQNTVNPRPRYDAMPKDMQFEKEKTPVLTATLIPGDWLYIPTGYWHMAKCTEDSLSISIGILPDETSAP